MESLDSMIKTAIFFPFYHGYICIEGIQICNLNISSILIIFIITHWYSSVNVISLFRSNQSNSK